MHFRARSLLLICFSFFLFYPSCFILLLLFLLLCSSPLEALLSLQNRHLGSWAVEAISASKAVRSSTPPQKYFFAHVKTNSGSCSVDAWKNHFLVCPTATAVETATASSSASPTFNDPPERVGQAERIVIGPTKNSTQFHRTRRSPEEAMRPQKNKRRIMICQ